MRTHRLKTWPEFFARVLDGSKPFEIRRDDRGFAEGDLLVLEEWDPARTHDGLDGYTGRKLERVVTYKFGGGRYGIPEGVCVLGLRPTPTPPATGGGDE